MRSSCERRVIEGLIVIPIVAIKRQRTDTAIVGRKSSTDEHARRILSGYARERFVLGSGINRGQTLKVDRLGAVITNSERIDERGAEHMSLFQHNHVSPGVRVHLVVVHAVGLNVA